MTDKILLDTNILVYIYDHSESIKQQKAIRILDRLIPLEKAVISTQILAEFYAATTKAKRSLLTRSEALQKVIYYANIFKVVEINKPVIVEAVKGVEKHSFSFWDAQVWATARIYSIPVILSEDFNSGSSIENVSFENPFLT
jgi:predicted nucleic acid-binding protein